MRVEEIKMIKEACTVIFLGISGWLDWKTKQISLVLTGIYGAAGLMNSCLEGRRWEDFILPAGIGLLFLLLSLAAEGAVGMGDGWVLLSLGCMLETDAYIRLFGCGILLAAVFSGVLMVGYKKRRNMEIPFVPFLFWGYLGGVLLWK